jgi:hypothetical protein
MATELGIPLTLWCRKHEQPYKSANANMIAAVNRLMHFAIKKMAAGIPEDAPDFERRFATVLAGVSESGKPVCCHLSDADHETLFADMIQSTGDAEEDKAEAIAAIPEVQPCDEPQLKPRLQ